MKPLLTGLVSVGFAMALWLCATVICDYTAATEYRFSESKTIVALNDGSKITGHFYLGAGSVSEVMKYYFIEETDKGMRMNSVGADNAYIVETNSETPRVEVYKEEYKNVWVNLFAFNWGETEYKIYIPENSITTEFNVNLE